MKSETIDTDLQNRIDDLQKRIFEHSKQLFIILNETIDNFIENEDFGDDAGQKILVVSCTLGGIKFLSTMLLTFSKCSSNPEKVFRGFIETFNHVAECLFKNEMDGKSND